MKTIKLILGIFFIILLIGCKKDHQNIYVFDTGVWNCEVDIKLKLPNRDTIYFYNVKDPWRYVWVIDGDKDDKVPVYLWASMNKKYPYCLDVSITKNSKQSVYNTTCDTILENRVTFLNLYF